MILEPEHSDKKNLPAVTRSKSYGLRTIPKAEPIETAFVYAHSAMLVLASTMAPAAFNCATWHRKTRATFT